MTVTGRPRSRISAGLLMFRRKGSALEVLLVHPGAPFFQSKNEGAWTIPKGEAFPRRRFTCAFETASPANPQVFPFALSSEAERQ